MAKPLSFKPKWIEPILQGTKTATIRRSGSGYESGDVVKAMVRRRPAFAELRITRVETVRLNELTRAHARLEGQPDLDSLRLSLEEIYPAEHEFDVIVFETVSA